MRKRSGYSVQIIRDGAPAPIDWKPRKRQATDIAAVTAKATGLEVRVWDTRTARCVAMIAAPEGN